MRSTAYSLFTTLLLLVPISAVPLMAIFGVPQFAPKVASPLDDAEEDEWDRPSRRKPRTLAKSDRSIEGELDFPAEESMNWDDPPAARPRPVKKKARPAVKSTSEEAAPEVAETSRPKKPPASRSKGRAPASPFDEEPAIRNVAQEADADEPTGVETADFTEDSAADAGEYQEASPEIPSYRRSRSHDEGDAERDSAPPSARPKRPAPASAPPNWKQAVQRLNELGIRNFRLEPGVRPGEFTFTCSYTPSNTPHVTRKFEADADDPLKAVAKVLSQVEEASQQRVLAAPRKLAEQRERGEPE